jgi:hypothetical protein
MLVLADLLKWTVNAVVGEEKLLVSIPAALQTISDVFESSGRRMKSGPPETVMFTLVTTD